MTTIDAAVPAGSPIITRFMNGVTADLQLTFDRIAAGATGSPTTPAALQDWLSKYPILGLKKIIAIDKTGALTEFNFVQE
ncbi:hypothetical protein IB278_17060 [Variovorax sp. VRV01]|uniref:hypothetical protein n=1 Tax=Variovorax sp. VRV01 TaxID=2769259 RepID=UPI00177FB968|nr:hypothetical protein [Variovorax sp. VRV01]MBD9665680.1 hypothetical protein [Variovorax sp. VRV01]